MALGLLPNQSCCQPSNWTPQFSTICRGSFFCLNRKSPFPGPSNSGYACGMMRKLIAIPIQAALFIAGLSMVLSVFFEGGKALVLIGGIWFLILAGFWIKEDWFPPQP